MARMMPGTDIGIVRPAAYRDTLQKAGRAGGYAAKLIAQAARRDYAMRRKLFCMAIALLIAAIPL
ncbi:MAG TPA: hypothetical protein GX509_08190 [Firmicutes bacterium]|nr:hypothetical protein [Bacillota bacterium]